MTNFILQKPIGVLKIFGQNYVILIPKFLYNIEEKNLFLFSLLIKHPHLSVLLK